MIFQSSFLLSHLSFTTLPRGRKGKDYSLYFMYKKPSLEKESNLLKVTQSVVSTRTQMEIFLFFCCQTRAFFSQILVASPRHIANLSNLPCSHKVQVISINPLLSDSWVCSWTQDITMWQESIWLGVWKYDLVPGLSFNWLCDHVFPKADLNQCKAFCHANPNCKQRGDLRRA